MPMLNPFGTDAFNLVSMVQAINKLPNLYGRVMQMGLFRTKSVSTRTVLIDHKDGVINILDNMPVGSPGLKNTKGTRRTQSLVIPHFPLDDTILASEYDGIRAFGQENVNETLASIMNDHLQTLKNKHDQTLEWLMMGALKGIVYDSDASTVIYNFHKEFLQNKKEVDFVLGTSTTNIKAKCKEVLRHIETHLQGERMTGVRVLCDKDFMDSLTNHAKVIEAYERWEAGTFLRQDDRKGFYFCGLTFEEYEGTTFDKDGTVRKFLSSKDCIAFPEGTTNTFNCYYAPADFMETVNTLGLPYYAKQQARDFNRGIDIHTQSNPLPVVSRPELCVRVYSST
ncbi:MAG: major capsid protein [Candidatus Thorarchaeota archaeon]